MHAGAENMREELSRALQQLSRFQSQFSEDVEKMARGRTEEVVRQLDQERKQYEEWRQATLANFESIRTVHPLKDTRTFVEGEIQKLLTETRRTPPPPPGTKQVLDQMLHRYLLQREKVLQILNEAEARISKEVTELEGKNVVAAARPKPLA